MTTRTLLETFYKSFQARDAEGMKACYHKDVQFSDPVFPDLRGDDAGWMWKMLCVRGKDLVLEFSILEANETGGKVAWDAHYTFQATKRKVHNKIVGTFRIQDGKIIEHRDVFSFWRWTRMALGPMGWLLGWTPLVQNKVRQQAAKGLAEFKKSQQSEK